MARFSPLAISKHSYFEYCEFMASLEEKNKDVDNGYPPEEKLAWTKRLELLRKEKRKETKI